MSSEIINFEAYHGTSKKASISIIESRKYIASNNDNEWLGSGVYFFIDYRSDKSIENSMKWAVNFKRFGYYAVLKNNIKVHQDKVVNLNDPEWQDIFQSYRDEKQKDYERRGITCTMKVKQFDCLTINDMCEELGIDVVCQQRYIELGERRKDRNFISSNIPNCRIMSVRNPEVIEKESICVVKEGMA